MNIFWLAQGIGLVALGLLVFSYQSKTRSQMLNRQILSSLIFFIHFSLLFAWTGALTNLVVVGRNWVFARKGIHAWADHIGWVVLFCALSLGTLYFSWDGFISVLPVASVILGIYSRWQEHASQIRAFGLVGCVLLFPYSLVVHSYAGMATQVVIATGIVYGMVKHEGKITLPFVE